jgi:hypothetical protein
MCSIFDGKERYTLQSGLLLVQQTFILQQLQHGRAT